MEIGIINNTNNSIQIYAECNKNPVINDIDTINKYTGIIGFVGAHSNADVSFIGNCTDNNIIIMVWGGEELYGNPDSWLILDNDGIINSNFNNYRIEFDRQTNII